MKQRLSGYSKRKSHRTTEKVQRKTDASSPRRGTLQKLARVGATPKSGL